MKIAVKKIIVSKWFLFFGILGLCASACAVTKLTYKGEKEYIIFRSDIDIEGLLVRPHAPGPHPAIILLHGAGESHQGYDKLFFRFHANAFLKRGFAVLLYNKRGSGDNNIDYKYFTYNELMKDALAAVQFLKKQNGINRDKIGLMGLSESGWFTPEVAAIDGNIKFIINRVSSPFAVTKTIIHERRMDALAEGFTEKEVEEDILPLTTRIWQFYIDVYNSPSLANGPERTAINNKLSEMHSRPHLKKWFTYGKLTDYEPKLYESKGRNYSYDPLPFLKKIDIPMLYVMGGKDVNMPTTDIVKFLEKFREEEGKKIAIKVYPNASHYLYRWGLGDGPFEGWLYEKGYLDLLSNWAKEQID